MRPFDLVYIDLEMDIFSGLRISLLMTLSASYQATVYMYNGLRQIRERIVHFGCGLRRCIECDIVGVFVFIFGNASKFYAVPTGILFHAGRQPAMHSNVSICRCRKDTVSISNSDICDLNEL